MESSTLTFPSHWDVKQLASLTETNNISYGIVQPGKHDPNGIPIIRVNNFTDYGVDTSDVLKVSSLVASKFEKTKLKTNDVLITLVGSTGKTFIVPEKYEGWNVPRAVGVIRSNGQVSSSWLKVCLDSSYTKHFLDARANTTVQKTLNLSDVKQIPIPIPPEKERVLIEYVANSLASKIDLNQSINQTIEQIAQALFKSWFIDFDPVIDNALAAGKDIPDALLLRAELRQKAQQKPDFKPLPKEIRALFPNEFEHSGIFDVGYDGWVPKGWESSSLGERVTVKRGGSPRPIKDFIVPKGMPWTKISDATASTSRFIKSTKEYIRREGLSKTTLLKKGSLILSNSATPGLPKFLDLDACVHDGWLHFPEKNGLSDLYLYQLFLVIRKRLVQQGNGSVFTNLKTDILKSHNIVVPNANVLMQFDSIASEFHAKMLALTESTITLKTTRDTILPKLISGELKLDMDIA